MDLSIWYLAHEYLLFMYKSTNTVLLKMPACVLLNDVNKIYQYSNAFTLNSTIKPKHPFSKASSA